MSGASTTAREHKHRRYSGRASAVPYGAAGAARMQRAYRAVLSEFHWLSLAQVENPPRQMFDAKLARQIAIHLMVNRMGMEQRQVSRVQGRQRTSIHFALRTVDERLRDAPFAASYERMAGKVQIEGQRLPFDQRITVIL